MALTGRGSARQRVARYTRRSDQRSHADANLAAAVEQQARDIHPPVAAAHRRCRLCDQPGLARSVPPTAIPVLNPAHELYDDLVMYFDAEAEALNLADRTLNGTDSLVTYAADATYGQSADFVTANAEVNYGSDAFSMIGGTGWSIGIVFKPIHS